MGDTGEDNTSTLVEEPVAGIPIYKGAPYTPDICLAPSGWAKAKRTLDFTKLSHFPRGFAVLKGLVPHSLVQPKFNNKFSKEAGTALAIHYLHNKYGGNFPVEAQDFEWITSRDERGPNQNTFYAT